MEKPSRASSNTAQLPIALLTGGDDRPYALGITAALTDVGIAVEFIGSDALDSPELHQNPGVTFLNLRGDQSTEAPLLRKIGRILRYYCRLLCYTVTAKPRIFHILWNNKFAFVDRVLLMLWYRSLRKKVILTAHNVNAGKRDGNDSVFNRLTLRFQYHLCHHIFVHTPRMLSDLEAQFGVPTSKISVIPFGINNTTPTTGVTRFDARARFGVKESEKTLLFFGQIAPYKGLEFLLEAIKLLTMKGDAIRLIIAGRVKQGHEEYWGNIQKALAEDPLRALTICHIRFIPDTDVEWYMQAADAVVIPYIHIFQSGVPFLAFSFGLPVIATDIGALRDDIIDEQTGFLCAPRDSNALALSISRYFSSSLYRNLEETRRFIQHFANEHHSWQTVGMITRKVYSSL